MRLDVISAAFHDELSKLATPVGRAFPGVGVVQDRLTPGAVRENKASMQLAARQASVPFPHRTTVHGSLKGALVAVLRKAK